MNDILMRMADNLLDRVTGPLHFRIFLQPALAITFAIIHGWKDAKARRTPYFWSLVTEPAHRAQLEREGWKDVGKVFILALVLDAIYQFMVQRFVYPGELIIVAVVLAILPYVLLRSLVTRLMFRRPPRGDDRSDKVGGQPH